MNKLPLLLSLGILLVGCSSPQVIKLKDGSTITTPDEVYYNEDSGFYEYEDSTGRERSVNKNEIVIIEDL